MKKTTLFTPMRILCTILLIFALASCNKNQPTANNPSNGSTANGENSANHVHVPEIDAAVEPTCAETGLTEGSHCSACGEILVNQETIIALGHSYDNNDECTVCKASTSDIEDLKFELLPEEQAYMLSGRQSLTATEVNIPRTYKNLPVTRIDGEAFWGCSSLTSVSIPDSITSIGWSVFRECSNLTSIVIPNSVTTLDNYTFTDCSSLTSVVLPNSITIIGEHMFSGCSGLTSIVIPDSVTYIDICAFSDCTNLTDINIPIGVTDICSSAFRRCLSLTGITIPNGVINIGDRAFGYCIAIPSITIPNSVKTIGEYAFSGCEIKSIIIPDGVTSINYRMFFECSAIESITIPNSITRIDDDVFSDCFELKSITFNGTKEEWNAIEKSDEWDSFTGEYTIYCTNGNIEKQID